MNGAESMVRTLVACGVDLCFANPGTSEMHFVGALDRVDGLRCVLGLFEGVVTGAADGYYRMADKPAATLLHLAPGLGNGLANLHNARKARSGIVNVVGQHARAHLAYDAPLTADVEGTAKPMSDWVFTASSAQSLAADTARAVQVACTPPGKIATLIVPADATWDDADGPARPLPPATRPAVDEADIAVAARALAAGGPRAMLLLGGVALRDPQLKLAARIAAKTGCRLSAEYSNARLQRGQGRVNVPRVPYAIDQALATFRDLSHLVLLGSELPVAFFAYPGKPSELVPDTCQVIRAGLSGDDLDGVLRSLAEHLQALRTEPAGVSSGARPEPGSGALTLEGIGTTIAALLPDDAVVVDESISTGRGFPIPTASSGPHDWLAITGGAIGFGLPHAVGAAIGAPNRKIVALQADGSGMYTLQALWTMAREQLDVVIVVFANRSYKILMGELASVGGATPGGAAQALMSLDGPALDWVSLAKGHGVPAGRASTLDELTVQFRRGVAAQGPYLIELVM